MPPPTSTPVSKNTPPASPARTEKDTMGPMEVPADALYGASTQRAVLNFPVSGRPIPERIIKAYAVIKAACATVNQNLNRLDTPRADAIRAACEQIEAGLPDRGGIATHFPIDIFQTGSGTSTNMNANEVIANLVCLAKGMPIGSSKDPTYLQAGGVHPNDHVNMGQSSNDTFPTAIHLAAAIAIHNDLLPAVQKIARQLDAHAQAWDRIVKIGRTHLQDATPIRLGQEFSGYASQMYHAEGRLHRALHTLAELPIGGTAVGTGINTHEHFGSMVAAELNRMLGFDGGATASERRWGGESAVVQSPSPAPGWGGSGGGGPSEARAGGGESSVSLSRSVAVSLPFSFREAHNHFESQHAKDAVVEASSHLRTLAISLSKIANDIRWLGSGPRCGLGELVLPAVQPGSSIMPGKTNPVIAESVIMVCCQVQGNDTAIALGGWGGIGSLLDLNVAMPMMAANLLDSIHLLTRACHVFTDNLLKDLQPDEDRCKSLIEGSLAMCTSLVPIIGYDKSAALAKEAFKQGKTVRELAYETVVGQKDNTGKPITREDIDTYLDPWSMTLPGGEGSAGG